MKNVLQTGRMDNFSQMVLMEETRWALRTNLWLDHAGVIGVLAMSGFSQVGRVRDSSMLIY